MKASERATRELRAGLAFILRRIEAREAAGLPPQPDCFQESYWLALASGGSTT